ncbi:MAG: 7-cyano-7-deazaguanine synthase [Candidatus Aenigmatarchaeota archaeon]
MKKIVCLLSGGIDSPVAAAMLSKKHEIVLVHLDNAPMAPKIVKERVMKLAKLLAKISGRKTRLYIVPHGENLKSFLEVERKMNCILCRRMMYRIANEIAKREGADAIATGESLAQVASQTLPNLRAEDAASILPVLRPLIGMEKSEIVALAKKVGTFETSVERDKGCYTAKSRPMCCFATPIHPETRADLASIEAAEKKLDIRGMLEKSVSASEVIEL